MSETAQENTKQAPKVTRKKGTELTFQIGTRVLIEPTGSGKRFWTEMIGMVRGKVLLVRLPGQLELRQLLKPETDISARFLYDGYNICGFRTSVAAVVPKPLPLLYLHCPTHFEIMNLRQHDRVNCFFPSTIFHDGAEHYGPVVNLSRGGCRIITDSPSENGDGAPSIQQDDEIFCQLKLEEGGEEFFVKGMVKSSSIMGDKLMLGVEFDDTPQEAEDAIDAFVSNALAYQMTQA